MFAPQPIIDKLDDDVAQTDVVRGALPSGRFDMTADTIDECKVNESAAPPTPNRSGTNVKPDGLRVVNWANPSDSSQE